MLFNGKIKLGVCYMPLRKDKNQSAVSYNISELIRSGHKRSQAIAISMKLAGKSKKKRGRNKRRAKL